MLVGLIVKLSPRTNSPWTGKGPPCQSLGVGGGGGCCKSVVLSVGLALEESFSPVMSAFSLSCHILLMFEAHWPMKAFSSSTC